MGTKTPFLPGQSCEYRDAYSAYDGQQIPGIHQQLWAAREDSSPADDACGGSLSKHPQLPENFMKIPEEAVGNAAPQTDPVSPLGSGDRRPAQAVGASSPAKRHKNRSKPQNNKKRYPGGNWPDEIPYFNEVTFADDGGSPLGELILNDDPF